MKRRYTPLGKPYMFSEDDFTEGLAVAICACIHLVDKPERLTFKERLWAAAYEYIEMCDDKSELLKSRFLGIQSSQDEEVYFHLKETIGLILSLVPFKEKKVKLEWGKRFKTKNGVLVRETKDGRFVSLITLTNGIILNQSDYTALLQEIGVDVDELTFLQFNKLEYDIRGNLEKYSKKYKSLKCFVESLDIQNRDSGDLTITTT